MVFQFPYLDYYNPANKFAKSLFNHDAKVSSTELRPAFDFSDIEKIKSFGNLLICLLVLLYVSKNVVFQNDK